MPVAADLKIQDDMSRMMPDETMTIAPSSKPTTPTAAASSSSSNNNNNNMNNSMSHNNNNSNQMEIESDSPSPVSFSSDDPDKPIVDLEASAGKHTVIIFDWDDTLLASSFLSSKGLRLDTETEPPVEVSEQLKLLEKSVVAVISRALEFGEVHIVTNAESGWVQLSAKKFIPGVLSILERVTVISARSTYERLYPEAPLKWKYYAFQDRLKEKIYDVNVCKNVISFGDSHVEREAVRAVTRGVPNTVTKSVKFAERPTMEQLRRQIELVASCFQFIYNHQGDLDLMLTISMMQEVCA